MNKWLLLGHFTFFNASLCIGQTQFLKDSGTRIKNPYALRDPFRKMEKKRTSGAERTKKYLGTKLSNLGTIEGVPLDDIVIVGVLLGKERRALAKLLKDKKEKNAETFILKEGMNLGQDKALLKAILPGGIVVVEKIRNVYEQDEYIETIIPIVPE